MDQDYWQKSNDLSKQQDSPESRWSYAGVRIMMLASVFGRKVTDEMVEVYRTALCNYPVSVLAKAFAKAEQGLERFPTPKIMRELCNGEMPSTAWKYNLKDSRDREGTPCKIDPETGEYLYLPQNCPEGRAYLAKMREIAGRK